MAAQTQSFETPDKAQAFFVAGMNLNLRDDDPDYPALVLGNYMLGGGFLNSRLVARIRIKDGLSYGVGSQLKADAARQDRQLPGLCHLRAAEPREAGAGVQGRDDARAQGGLHRRGNRRRPSPAGCRAAASSRSQDNELVGHPRALPVPRPHACWDADFEKKVMALDAEQIRAAMNKYIEPAKFVVMKAGDFAGAARRGRARRAGSARRTRGGQEVG